MEVADACLDVGNPFFTILRKLNIVKMNRVRPNIKFDVGINLELMSFGST